jgi:hypothetical protein
VGLAKGYNCGHILTLRVEPKQVAITMTINRYTLYQSVAAVFFSLFSIVLLAQPLVDVTAEVCVRGDCVDGRGRLELSTEWGKGEYNGNFKDGEFHGSGRLEVPISFTAKSIYVGNWDMGIRSGRGTFWNGKGRLYIGQWKDDKRNGQGSYFFGLDRWRENEHSEYWMKENIENYSGNFVDDYYQGQGTYRWPGGQKYVGGFFANEKHGQGTYYYSTGSPRQQVWEYGDFVR